MKTIAGRHALPMRTSNISRGANRGFRQVALAADISADDVVCARRAGVAICLAVSHPIGVGKNNWSFNLSLLECRGDLAPWVWLGADVGFIILEGIAYVAGGRKMRMKVEWGRVRPSPRQGQ